MASELDVRALFKVLTVPSKAVPRRLTSLAVSRSVLPASSEAESELVAPSLVASISPCVDSAKVEKVLRLADVEFRVLTALSSAVSSFSVKLERLSSVR